MLLILFTIVIQVSPLDNSSRLTVISQLAFVYAVAQLLKPRLRSATHYRSLATGSGPLLDLHSASSAG